METGKEFPPTVERDPSRAQEQADAESIARHLLWEFDQEYKKRPGVLDQPEELRRYESVKEFLEDEAEDRSDFMRFRQDARVLLRENRLDVELRRLNERLSQLEGQLSRGKTPKDFPEGEYFDLKEKRRTAEVVRRADSLMRRVSQDQLKRILTQLRAEYTRAEQKYHDGLLEASQGGLEGLTGYLDLDDARERLEQLEELMAAGENIQREASSSP